MKSQLHAQINEMELFIFALISMSVYLTTKLWDIIPQNVLELNW